MDTLIIVAVAVALVLVTVWPYVRKVRRQEAENRARLERSAAAGLDEPPTLHPVVDPGRCVGSGACVTACPEGDILGLIDGRPALLNASRCVGHGQCAAACPVEAISLVFGTARRGVDIPHVRGNFETNVPGIYIVGELGGMGLIRNALRQGRQAVEGIARDLVDRPEEAEDGVLDLLVAGAGPAGIAASLAALEQGLSCRTVEQEEPGGAVRHYPRQKLVMTEPMDIPAYGRVRMRQASKEQLLELWDEVVAKTGLRIHTGERLADVARENGAFRVETSQGSFKTRRVVLAIGRRGTPRKLGVPGEELDKVAYRLLEPEQVGDSRVLVVGGGNSALEVAGALVEQGRENRVCLAYRGEAFFRAREENLRRIEGLRDAGKLEVLFQTQVREIRPREVVLGVGEEERVVDNDLVFACTGGEVPTDFLRRLGIAIERKFGEA